MKIRTIQVQAGRTLDLPTGHRGTIRPFVTLTADLDDGDEVCQKVGELQLLAENLVEDHVCELNAYLVANHQAKKQANRDLDNENKRVAAEHETREPSRRRKRQPEPSST